MNAGRRRLLDARQVETCLADIAEQIAARLGARNPLLLGIHRGGVQVAKALHSALALTEPMGTLDIAFYRDDVSTRRLNPQVQPSNLPVPVEGRHVILVDDVLFTGRTVRAALNEIFDYGRPASVALAVLIEREGQQLPIRSDFCGINMTLPDHEQLRLKQDPSGLQVWIEGDDGP